MSIIKSFLDLIYPQRCLICNTKSDQGLCESCINEISKIEYPFCLRCGVSLKEYNVVVPICKSCREGRRYNFRLARQVGLYEDKLKIVINAFKYKRKKKLAIPLGELLVDYLRKNDDVRINSSNEYRIKNIEKLYFPKLNQIDYLIPVPLTPLKTFMRGFNQSELLCKIIEDRTGIPLLSDYLIKVKNTKPQMSIKKGKETYRLRKENVKDAFKVKDSSMLKNKNILLIDDVFTTGATCNECARVLKQSGCRNVYVLTLARGG